VPQSFSSTFNLEYLKKAAKQLLDACRAGDSDAIGRVQAALPRLHEIDRARLQVTIRLADVHHALARESGFASWGELTRSQDPLARFLAAVRGNHVRTVRQHLSEFAPLALRSIHAAAALGHTDALRRHLHDAPALASAVQDGWTPFMYVCGSPLPRISARHASNLVECATLLLDAGADGRLPIPVGDANAESAQPAVFRALMHGNILLVTMLQKRGVASPADYLQKWITAERSPDYAAMQQTFAEYFRRPDVRERFSSIQSSPVAKPALGAIAFADPMELQQLQLPNLIGARADLWTAMLDNGFNPTNVSTTGRSALHGVAAYAPPSLVHAFLARGGDPTVRDADGRSVIATAIRAGNLEVADLLKSRGVPDDSSPIDRLLGACLAGKRDEALALAAANRDLVRSPSREDVEVVVRAAGRGNVGQIRLMLDAGFDPNAEGEGGATPLHQAAWRGQLDVVELLLDRGAKPAIKDRLYAETSVEWALDGAEHVAGDRDRCLVVAERLRG
jgi:ankyrin repeat protein